MSDRPIDRQEWGEISRRLARLEGQVAEALKILRRMADKENAPPAPPKFRRVGGGRWEVWCGEGTGWVEWHGPEPKENKPT
jgi:hypothetical protein